MAKLLDKDKNRIVQILESGEDLPVDYKHILFPAEKKEYELVYADKEREEDILADTMAVPLQPVKTFGTNRDGWTNKLIFGDNLQIMKSLLDDADVKGRVKLIYIDPPFGTGAQYDAKDDIPAYSAKLKGVKYLEFLRKRVVFLHSILSYSGLFVCRIDYHFGHYIKILMDEIFGKNHFINEIIVKRGKQQFGKSNKYTTATDSLFIYSKTNNYTFNKFTRERYAHEPKSTNLLMKGERYPRERTFQDHNGNPIILLPPPGKHWKFVQIIIDMMYKKGIVEMGRSKNGVDCGVMMKKGEDWVSTDSMPKYRFDTDKAVDSNWTDISGYSQTTGYPTENSEQLLERVIKSTVYGDNDIILDCFVGSGTTLAVAEKLSRRWIGIDCGKLAMYTIQKRMLNLKKEIGNRGKRLKPKPFTLFTAGLYNFKELKKLPWNGWRKFTLLLFNCRDNKHKIAGVELDGYKSNSDVLVFNHLKDPDLVLDYGFVDDLHSLIGSKVSREFFIIAPAAKVMFLEDYIDKGDNRYYILRIPYSIINELHNRDFEAIKQPIDESQVNDTVDAVGFDFIRPPKVVCEYCRKKPKDELYEVAAIKIKTFKSEAMLKGASQLGNRESLSMVMVDFNYKNKGTFDLEKVFYASDIEKNKWEVNLPVESFKDEIMVIYLDIYGNEYREIKSLADFKHLSKREK